MLLERIGFETKAVATATIPPPRLSATGRLMRAVREIAGSLARIVEHRDSSPCGHYRDISAQAARPIVEKIPANASCASHSIRQVLPLAPST